MNWYIPDVEPYLIYAWQEISRWQGSNLLTISVILNVLAILKGIAIRSKSVVDDKIITMLIQIFSFGWLRIFKTKKEEIDGSGKGTPSI